ncbi:endoplasmic oxidoreductin-1 [Sporothrix curviconia]|uniref:Endoplasmic oxidoreductin-1 n=1 Tax=Sporothrix curviconia TaxID=1260050 RepID=A0ABP0BER0_9PEZI
MAAAAFRILSLLAAEANPEKGAAPVPSELRYIASNRSFSSSSPSYYQISPKAIVSDACASYSTLDKLNTRVSPAIVDLTQTTDFFSHYRVNLFHKTCPFWDDGNGMCGNIACAVQTLENEDDIPKVWRASELGKLQGPSAKHPGKSTQRERPRRPLQGRLGENVGESCVVEYDDECDDRDYCVPEDESAASKGDYVSLVQNPERFTGYAGDGAKQVWEAIYRENCFQKSSFPHSAQLETSDKAAMLNNPAAMGFRSVLEAAGRQQVLEQQRQVEPLTPFVAKTGLEVEDECIEKRVFYRLMSGMHASISTHLCWDFLNQTTGEWTPNVGCYVNRLHRFPDRISNLYFNYALLTRAVAKLGPHLERYIFCTGEPEQDTLTRQKVLAVTETAASVPQIFDESLMFKNGEGPSLKEDFRNRFRNVSRLMDCVGCDKCRLWGKLQTAGYGTALKVLFEYDNDGAIPQLQRTELVALFNTYARLSSSLANIQKFRNMVPSDEELAAEAAEAAQAAKSIASSDNAAVSSSHPSTSGKTEQVSMLPDRVRKPHNVVTSPQKQKEEDVLEEVDEKFSAEPTVREMFDEELGRVVHAFRIVVGHWLSFPRTFFNILTSELLRAWQFFIGLPVNPRTWEFRRPSLDELYDEL